MSFAKFLVPVTGASRDAIVLSTAFAAAKPFNAHVAALFVHHDPREGAAPMYRGAVISPDIVQGVIDAQTELAKGAQRAALSSLKAAAKDAGAVILDAPASREPATCSFHSRLGYAQLTIAEAAKFADAVVFGPVNSDEGLDLTSAFLDTLTRVERPVILSAKAPVEPFARSIAIAWDGGNAAAHAVTAALPYLERAARVEILIVGRSASGAGVRDLREYLSLHGFTATERKVDAGHESIGERLMQEAVSGGADLLVMGGYGHSHLRETIFGGVTRQIVSQPALPIFLMH
jgi:nucleotide-binding universal stress UspA family protein